MIRESYYLGGKMVVSEIRGYLLGVLLLRESHFFGGLFLRGPLELCKPLEDLRAREKRQCSCEARQPRARHKSWRNEHFLMGSFTLHGQDHDCDPYLSNS